MTTRWLSTEESHAWRAYLEASRLLTDALDRQLQRDSDIPVTYYEILVRLSDLENRSMRMSELAEAIRYSPSRLTHAVNRLEERGWVQRRACDDDRRGQVATLTDAGFAALAAAAPGHVTAVREYLIDRLTPEQLRQLAAIGDAIITGLGGRGCDGAGT